MFFLNFEFLFVLHIHCRASGLLRFVPRVNGRTDLLKSTSKKLSPKCYHKKTCTERFSFFLSHICLHYCSNRFWSIDYRSLEKSSVLMTPAAEVGYLVYTATLLLVVERCWVLFTTPYWVLQSMPAIIWTWCGVMLTMNGGCQDAVGQVFPYALLSLLLIQLIVAMQILCNSRGSINCAWSKLTWFILAFFSWKERYKLCKFNSSLKWLLLISISKFDFWVR